jgi:hypothetical protein
MTNVLSDSADTLASNHWCTGSIKDGDKFCAVGAIGYHLGLYGMETDLRDVKNLNVYEEVRKSDAGKALAEEIMSSDYATGISKSSSDDGYDDYLADYFKTGHYDDVIVEFNDAQTSVEPVIEMFRKAAARLDS